VATASHELRTPLASLDGTLELLGDDLDPQRLDLEDARERTVRAREQSRRLSRLATDLLDLSRLDAEVSLRAEPVELGELCRAVAAEFERRASEHGVRIDVRQASQGCWASCDPGAVARIMRILFDNAIGIAPSGSHVRAQASAQDSQAQITVSDSGPGVPESERERIFERFQRGSNSGGHSGFGLGLAIGRELATRMSGSLTLLDDDTNGSEAPDTAHLRPPHERASDTPGARFALRLPVARVDQRMGDE
jgi:signal transduction histidine kinase